MTLRDSLLRRHFGFFVVMLALIILFFSATLLYAERAYTRAFAGQLGMLQLQASGLETQFAREILALDLALQQLDTIEHQAPLERQLRNIVNDAHFVTSISIADDNGKLITSTNMHNIGVQIVLDDVLPLAESYQQRMQFAQPWSGHDFADAQEIRGTATSEVKLFHSFMPLIRRVGTGTHEIILVIALDPESFIENTAIRFMPGAPASVDIMRDDGRILASTQGTARIGMRWGSAELRGEPEAITINGQQQLSALQRSRVLPVHFVSYTERAAAMADWRTDMLQIMIFMLVYCLLFIVLATLTYRHRVRTTAQKTAVKQEKIERLKELINALPAQVLQLDENGYVLLCNQRWDDFVCNVDKTLGEHFTLALRQLNPLEIFRNSHAIAQINAVLSHAVPSAEFEQEANINGRHYWLQTIVRPVHAQLSQGVLFMQIDISQRKQAEYERDRNIALLRHSQQQLTQQKIALDEHAVVTTTDLQGRITYVNDKFVQLSGYSRDQIIGQNHRVNKSTVHPPAFFANMMAVISAGDVWHGDIANRNSAGNIYWVDSTIAPLLDEHGLPMSYICIQTDITLRKQTQEALAQARARELETGNAIQRALLLEDAPTRIIGATVATYSEPSQGIDGDFFAFSYYSPDCFDVLVGDVMGKGTNAALIGAAVKNDFHKVLAELLADTYSVDLRPSTADIVNALHARLTPRLIALDVFVTMALYRVDRANGKLSFVNAGHTPAILSRHDGRMKSILGENLPIGVMRDEIYRESVIRLVPGDALTLYSDGMSETRNPRGEEFGEPAMQDLIARARACGLPPATTVQMLRKVLRDFAGSLVLTDDQTMVMIETHAKDEVVLQDFALDRSALPALRQFILQHCRVLDAEAAEDVLLASFEAATNVIRHVPPTLADGSLSVRISHSAAHLCVELFYLGAPFVPDNNALPDFSGDAEGGFGLFIIRNLVDQVEYLNPLGEVCCIRLHKNLMIEHELA